MEDLNTSLNQYKDQRVMVVQALESVVDETERDSLITLQSDLEQLIQLTQENLDSIKTSSESTEVSKEAPKEIDDEYALFMADNVPFMDVVIQFSS
ncbi:putative zinc finger, CCCH-type with G patch domain protein [Operophtera brumata]|uniref:Putative zinc finger, CCCH-type with G patch domain protein n=1 Tax=Operophtera brumata TaxID=104452 RepID=A0A0L7KSV7_OPEBR|nr:putative zinc finger, CCCH-type with G patch domain protein [Operophtera brumata]